MYIRNLWGSYWNSDSRGLGRGLGACISNKQPGDACSCWPKNQTLSNKPLRDWMFVPSSPKCVCWNINERNYTSGISPGSSCLREGRDRFCLEVEGWNEGPLIYIMGTPEFTVPIYSSLYLTSNTNLKTKKNCKRTFNKMRKLLMICVWKKLKFLSVWFQLYENTYICTF